MRVGDNNDKYVRTTDFDWRSHVSGMSMWEILQKTIKDCRFIRQRVAVNRLAVS